MKKININVGVGSINQYNTIPAINKRKALSNDVPVLYTARPPPRDNQKSVKNYSEYIGGLPTVWYYFCHTPGRGEKRLICVCGG